MCSRLAMLGVTVTGAVAVDFAGQRMMLGGKVG